MSNAPRPAAASWAIVDAILAAPAVKVTAGQIAAFAEDDVAPTNTVQQLSIFDPSIDTDALF